MRAKFATLFCSVFILWGFVGCASSDTALSNALHLRESILQSNGCAFQTEIVVDYVDRTYSFRMECQFDKTGAMTFSVMEPETISGVTGMVSETGGSLTFDEKALAFPMIADDRITPVSAPWLLVKALRSGYLSGCALIDNGYLIAIDDSYEENALHVKINVNNDKLPIAAEIFWDEYRVVALAVENFVYL